MVMLPPNFSFHTPRTIRRSVLAAALAIAAGLAGGVALNADETTEAEASAEVAAIDPAAVERGFEVWKGQDCIGCHGWAGNGERIGENPEGPSLRAIQMEAEFIKEVILCGRPGTQMPYHDPQAYVDDRCYGMTKADAEGLSLLEGKPMTAEEADDLVAYMQAKLIGRPDAPSQEDCKAYYGAKPFCDRYPTAADQGLE